jgi:hypothetical protein
MSLPAASARAATFTPPVTATTASATLPGNHRTSFVYYQRAAHEIAAVASLDGAIRRAIVVDFHESKPASLARESVPHHVNAFYGDTGLREEIGYIRFRRRIRQVTYEKFH